jgi:hypothetical protein
MFCAQIVGKPVIAPEPSAAPAVAAAPFNTLRRVTLVVFLAELMREISILLSVLEAGNPPSGE